MHKQIKPVRVLIVDDSAFMRRLLTDLLESSRLIEIVGIARNGREAIEKNQRLQPDVITLDVEMPVMNGLTALPELLRTRAVPIVMLSSLTQSGAKETLEALSRGAVDFVGKPDTPQEVTNTALRQAIIDRVLNAAGVEVSKLTVSPQPLVPPVLPAVGKITRPALAGPVRVVAIGTSTGGPRALQQLAEQLMPDGRTAYLVVQHMPRGFTRTLAERLDTMSELTIMEAADGQLEADRFYIAPGGYHLTVQQVQGKPYILLTDTPAVNGHRPSVDVLFNSLALQPGLCQVAVILTGMGADGARGLSALKATGAYTIAKDASSAVIFGMPKAAIMTGDVDAVIALPQIAEVIARGLAGGRES